MNGILHLFLCLCGLWYTLASENNIQNDERMKRSLIGGDIGGYSSGFTSLGGSVSSLQTVPVVSNIQTLQNVPVVSNVQTVQQVPVVSSIQQPIIGGFGGVGAVGGFGGGLKRYRETYTIRARGFGGGLGGFGGLGGLGGFGGFGGGKYKVHYSSGYSGGFAGAGGAILG